jgi:hypothetical protein
MTIRAEREPRFYFRFLLIGLAALGFALYCLYDGFIGYPHAQERALAFEKLLEEKRGDEWDAYATERGWSTTPPAESKSQEKYEVDVKMQFWMAGGSALVGFFPLLSVWRSRGRWIELNDQGLTSSWGQTVAFDQVESLEKRKWRSKGIAKLRYNDGGRTRTFVIDDFKFKRAPTDEILAELEKRIGLDKITGGPPEGFEPVVAEALAEAETAAEG